jgi:hypothetical protein
MTLEPDFVIWHRSMAAPILVYRTRRRGVLGRAVLLTLVFYALLICAVAAAELPWWIPNAQWHSPTPPVQRIVPITQCRPGLEPNAIGRCVPDCRASCRRMQVAEAQIRFYDSSGRTTGTAAPQGEGTVRYRDSSGRTVGTSTTDPSGTTRYYGPDGRSLGTSTGPARTPFPERR